MVKTVGQCFQSSRQRPQMSCVVNNPKIFSLVEDRHQKLEKHSESADQAARECVRQRSNVSVKPVTTSHYVSSFIKIRLELLELFF